MQRTHRGVALDTVFDESGTCRGSNIMVFSPFKVKVTYYHPVNQWLLGATNGNQGQTLMHLQCSGNINHS